MPIANRIMTDDPIVDHEIDPNGDVEHTIIIETTTAGLALHSFKPAGGFVEGSNLCIVNDSAVSITLKHDSATGTVGWRLQTDTAADESLGPRQKRWAKLIENSASHSNGWWFESA